VLVSCWPRASCGGSSRRRREAARGTALAREGKYALAIEHYKAASRLNPHLPGLQLNLGLAYFKSNHLREAAAAFEEAVRADSGSSDRALLGMSY